MSGHARSAWRASRIPVLLHVAVLSSGVWFAPVLPFAPHDLGLFAAEETPAQDTDNDGLLDVEEEIWGTNPRLADTDRDGLIDGWEVNGFRWGNSHEPLRSYGADPTTPDVFVEIDWMKTSDGDDRAGARLAFEIAVDVSRVFDDSETPIRLHFDLGPDITDYLDTDEELKLAHRLRLDRFAVDPDPRKILPYHDTFLTRPAAAPSTQLSLYEVYHDPGYVRPSRRNIFYYFVIAEQQVPDDRLAVPGNDSFAARVDSFTDDGARISGLRNAGVNVGVIYRRPVANVSPELKRYRYSVAFLHELGHAMGLGHGGTAGNGRWDHRNHKANYPSSMNYRYIFWGIDAVPNEQGVSLPVMGFSHGRFAELYEEELDEMFGMGPLPNAHILANLRAAHIENSPFAGNIDWNRDGQLTIVERDLDANSTIDKEPLLDHDDWRRFLAAGFDGIGENAFRGCGLSCAHGEETIRIVGDYNGDRRDEVLFLSGDKALRLRLNDSLERHVDQVVDGAVGEWRLSAGDHVVVGSFREADSREVLFHRGARSGLVNWSGAEPQLVWTDGLAIPPEGTDDGLEPWPLCPADQTLAVRLDAGSPELVAFSNGKDLALVTYVEGSGLRLRWHSQGIFAGGSGTVVTLQKGRRFADGSESLWVRRLGGLFEVRGPSVAPQVESLADTGELTGEGELTWTLRTTDELLHCDLSGDGVEELVVCRGAGLAAEVGSSFAVMQWSEGAARLVWRAPADTDESPEWTRPLHGRFVAELPGEQIVMVSGDEMVTWAWRADGTPGLDVVATNRRLLRSADGLSTWPLETGQRMLVGSFLPDRPHVDVIVMLNGYSLGVAQLDLAGAWPGFRPVLEVDGVVDTWGIHETDVIEKVEMDGDAMDELFIRKGPDSCFLDFTPEPRCLAQSRLVFNEMRIEDSPTFQRGDVNGDGVPDISDALRIVSHLFLGTYKLRCKDAGDVNDNGFVDVSDTVYLLTFLFAPNGVPPPPPRFPDRAIDPTPDALDCAEPP